MCMRSIIVSGSIRKIRRLIRGIMIFMSLVSPIFGSLIMVVRVVAETCTGIDSNRTRLPGSRGRELLEDDLAANRTVSDNVTAADSESIDVISVELSQGSQPLNQETA